MTKKPYLSDVNDEKLDFVAPYLVLIGEQAKSDTAQNGVEPQMVKLPEAKKGFVLLPRRWLVERSFA